MFGVPGDAEGVHTSPNRPRTPQDGPKSSQDASRRPQDALRRPRDASKGARAPKKSPRNAPKTPPRASGEPKNRARTAPKRLQGGPGPQNTIGYPHKSRENKEKCKARVRRILQTAQFSLRKPATTHNTYTQNAQFPRRPQQFRCLQIWDPRQFLIKIKLFWFTPVEASGSVAREREREGKHGPSL